MRRRLAVTGVSYVAASRMSHTSHSNEKTLVKSLLRDTAVFLRQHTSGGAAVVSSTSVLCVVKQERRGFHAEQRPRLKRGIKWET